MAAPATFDYCPRKDENSCTSSVRRIHAAGAAETFGREGTHQPVAIESKDEVGELARVFNTMVENRTRIESCIRGHSGAEFSHGICPECAKALYPEHWERIREQTGD